MPIPWRYSSLLIAGLLAAGCYDQGAESPVAPVDGGPGIGNHDAGAREQSTLYPVIAEVSSGTSKVTFLDAGEGRIFLTQLMDAGRESLINESMEGLTFAEIHARLAPGKPVPEALIRSTGRFTMEAGDAPEDLGPVRDEAAPVAVAGPLAKTAGQWDLWFQQNYCQSVNQCLLNRTGSATDWVQSTYRIRSIFHVMLYQGYQITAKVKVDGNTVATGTVLYGQVWSGWGQSGSSIWCGGRCEVTHRMEISDGSGDGWHISAWYSG